MELINKTDANLNIALIAKYKAKSDAQKALMGRVLFMMDNMPTIEAIPKADYETRLKADLKAILVELQLEIEENIESIVGHYDKDTPMANRPSYKIERNDVRQECIDIIQQKINSLKED